MKPLGSIGSDQSLARAAIEAALRSQSEAAARIDSAVRDAGLSAAQTEGAQKNSFGRALLDGIAEANDAATRVQELPNELVAGRVQDLHEIAIALKQSELTFKFALEVRNKLIDAYRETMRMSV
jgi:flagellar hook-basal body complex protein FliE